MNISPKDLGAQYDRASVAWPFITWMEKHHRLPPMLLYAVGSRETGLVNEVGDGGHGHGVFQLDDRSHHIPAGFDQNVSEQAAFAASELAQWFSGYTGWATADAGWGEALNRYNSGQPTLAGTTGGDYGWDVLERLSVLQSIR